MDVMSFSTAQGAVDSLLGKLAKVLVNEVQQLQGVRRDVRFIQEEMEIMNGLLLHLAGISDGGGRHHVSAWTRQVRELANASHGCINRYVRHVGAGAVHRRENPLWYLHRIHHLVRTMPARRRVAKEIQELKVRVREVGERRNRYGITVPLITGGQDDSAARRKPSGTEASISHAADQDDPRRLALLQDGAPTILKKDVDMMIKWLTEDAYDKRQLKFIPIVGPSCSGKSALAWRVYQDPSVTSLFDCKAWSNGGGKDGGGWSWSNTAAQLLVNLKMQHGVGMQMPDSDKPPEHELKGHLKGRKFLLVLDGLEDRSVVEAMEQTLQWCPYTSGSAVMVLTRNKSMVQACRPYNTLHLSTRTVVDSFFNRAVTMLPNLQYGIKVVLLRRLLSTLHPDTFSMKMLLHLLFVNPSWSTQELQRLCSRLTDNEPRKNAQEMLIFCYNDLPSHYRSCLLYLSIFPQGRELRRTTLVRRWAVEGMITKAGQMTMLDEADHCFDALTDRGFVHPEHVSAAGKVKVCRVHNSVHDFVTSLVKQDNLVETSVAPHLAPHLSIDSTIKQQPLLEKPQATCNALWNWIFRNHSARPQQRPNQFDNITTLLDWLPRSSQLELLKVLDLEDCKRLENRHLKIVCDHLLQLKYLNVRKTDITQLPKTIDKLQYLETLDIRETKVREFGKKHVILRMLKHLLAGHTAYSSENDVIKSSESFSTVDIPIGIRCMENIQILSHVNISSDDELKELCGLTHLKKLGLVIKGTQIDLDNLFGAISELSNCLRSLSIRIEPRCQLEKSSFKCQLNFLKIINISGLRDELPVWIEHLHQLDKVTLHETSLTENCLRTLGQLKGLRCLRLRHNSFIQSRLAFREDEFKNLKFLVVEGSHITNICFARKAAPRLEKIVWSFTQVQTISGVDHLPSLKEFELNRSSISDPAQQVIETYPNKRIFKTVRIQNGNKLVSQCIDQCGGVI